jgi:predicted DNA-binding antitoxin AbrB/MazE fold protein
LWHYNKKMKRELNVVFEKGVLRPLEPVNFVERQQLLVTVSDDGAANAAEPAPRTDSTRSGEQTWLHEHGREFVDQWVVVEGDRLVSHGWDAKAVFEEARAAGVAKPFLVQVTSPDDLPWGGW